MPYNEYDMVAVATDIESIFKEEVPKNINGWDVKPTYNVGDGDRGLMLITLTMTYSLGTVCSSSGNRFAIDPEDPTNHSRIRDTVWSMVRGVIHYTNDFYYSNLNEKEN